MLDLLEANFKSLSHADLVVRVGGIADALMVHPHYPLPWPDVVPNPEQLKEQVEKFAAALNAAANGDRQKILERDSCRIDVEQDVALAAQYVIMKSIKEKNPTMLLNTGFALKNRNYNKSSSNAVVGPPTNFTVRFGPASGTVFARATRQPGAATHDLQICEGGDPTLDESWRDLGQFVRCSRIEVKDLEPGKRYSFRIRARGINGPGAWSSIVSLIVI